MKLSEFKFNLPSARIATEPPYFRDESRLMVLDRATGEITEHKYFREMLDYFDDGDCFIFNDTKVFPARLYGNKEKTGAKIEVFLLRELNSKSLLWDVLVDPARKIRIGNKLYFGENESLVAEVIDNTTSRGRTLRFLFDGTHEEFKELLNELGETPIPHSMKREVADWDRERFQTIYAEKEGAVVAPAAGLHFSRELLKRMEIKGVDRTFITLHFGLGSFRRIEVEDLSKHKMDSEEMNVSEEATKVVNGAKSKGHKVVAVGSSVMRTIETCLSSDGNIKPYAGWTNKFIFPPYDFGMADALVTNFYYPGSPLLMMAAAFGGYENVMKAYKLAIKEKYQFGLYGDALMII